MNPGISFLHGGHQVAQKSNNTTLPLCSLRTTFLPLMSLRVKSRLAILASLSQTASAACAFYRCGRDMNKGRLTIIRQIIVLNIDFLTVAQKTSSHFSGAGYLIVKTFRWKG